MNLDALIVWHEEQEAKHRESMQYFECNDWFRNVHLGAVIAHGNTAKYLRELKTVDEPEVKP